MPRDLDDDDTDDFDEIQAAIVKAHAAGVAKGQQEALNELFASFGRQIATQLLPSLTPIATIVKASEPTDDGKPTLPDDSPDPHAALLLATLDNLIEQRESDSPDESIHDALQELWDDPDTLDSILSPTDDIYEKAWDESKHPRGKNGRYISKERIHEAKTNPKLAKELREEVKPADAKKLENALDGTTDTGRTARGAAKSATTAKRDKQSATRKDAQRIASDLMLHPYEATPDKFRELAHHLQSGDLRTEELRDIRLKLGAKFGKLPLQSGGTRVSDDTVPSGTISGNRIRRTEDMTKALLAHVHERSAASRPPEPATHELTRQEYRDKLASTIRPQHRGNADLMASMQRGADETHAERVKDAHARGDEIPEHVLADYPELSSTKDVAVEPSTPSRTPASESLPAPTLVPPPTTAASLPPGALFSRSRRQALAAQPGKVLPTDAEDVGLRESLPPEISQTPLDESKLVGNTTSTPVTSAGDVREKPTMSAEHRENQVAKLRKEVAGPQTVTQKRAYHGEIGPNGESYPGGAFIATADIPKRIKDKLIKSAKGRVRVGKDGTAVPEPGQMSIVDKLGGTVMNPRTGEINEQYLDYSKATPEMRDVYADLASKHQSGQEWVSVNDYPQLANLTDAARLHVAGQAIPGAILDKLPTEFRERLTKYQAGAAPESLPVATPAPESLPTPVAEAAPATPSAPLTPSTRKRAESRIAALDTAIAAHQSALDNGIATGLHKKDVQAKLRAATKQRDAWKAKLAGESESLSTQTESTPVHPYFDALTGTDVGKRLVEATESNHNETRRVAGKPAIEHELALVSTSSVKPSQTGEDYDNSSSRELAKHVGELPNSRRPSDYKPIIVDENNNIIDGNHRHAAHTIAGIPHIPVLRPKKGGKTDSTPVSESQKKVLQDAHELEDLALDRRGKASSADLKKIESTISKHAPESRKALAKSLAIPHGTPAEMAKSLVSFHGSKPETAPTLPAHVAAAQSVADATADPVAKDYIETGIHNAISGDVKDLAQQFAELHRDAHRKGSVAAVSALTDALRSVGASPHGSEGQQLSFDARQFESTGNLFNGDKSVVVRPAILDKDGKVLVKGQASTPKIGDEVVHRGQVEPISQNRETALAKDKLVGNTTPSTQPATSAGGASEGKTMDTPKKPWEMDPQEYGQFYDNLDKELAPKYPNRGNTAHPDYQSFRDERDGRRKGFVGNHTHQIINAITSGEEVPSHVITPDVNDAILANLLRGRPVPQKYITPEISSMVELRKKRDAASNQIKDAKLSSQWDSTREKIYIRTSNPSTGNVVNTPVDDLSEDGVKKAIKAHKAEVKSRDSQTRGRMAAEKQVNNE